MKSIHNGLGGVLGHTSFVIAHVKIQFEINSQHSQGNQTIDCVCDCSRKNTIWNQFTTAP